jgi:predicted 2-oxoglutarate/Fe(II)-dependent dioxygenase YbiX
MRRGDVAVYRSRHRHRVATVTAPRTVLAVEWWRGHQQTRPSRPGLFGMDLQEPLDVEGEKERAVPVGVGGDAAPVTADDAAADLPVEL